MERRLQREIVLWLKSQGAWVMKTRPGMGTPTGTADIFFCSRDRYGWLEVKASKTSEKQPGQERFIDMMDSWSYARFVWPENWPAIKAELMASFF